MEYYYNKAKKYKFLYQIGANDQPKIINLYFIRHGESQHNKNKNKNIFDPSLTYKGILQSKQLYNNIIKIKPDLIYTSPLKRSLQTLSYSLTNKNLAIPCNDRLRMEGLFTAYGVGILLIS
jgi:broad specificity phosphatase PhoE